eukprot:14677621-Ditylum_brightwellii.AAC.1
MPLLEVHEGGINTMSLFLDEYKDCLHDQNCLLASGNNQPDPFAGIPKRGDKVGNMSPYEGDQSELDKPEVAQQPTFE